MNKVIIVGAGHNGLVAATLLARAGVDVLILEEKPVVGGAVRTEYPFACAPHLGASTGAYLLGLMPPELIELLDVDIPVIRRDPHYFLPTTDGRYLLFGSQKDEVRRQFLEFFSTSDWEAHRALMRELAQLRDDIAPSWLQAPLSIEETAQQFVRPELQQIFIELCRGSVGDYLDRFGFESDLLSAMYAVTDGFSGLNGGWDTPGTGMNFLIHNMCRLPGSQGTWMIVKGGMGTVSQAFADAARKAGATICVDQAVRALKYEGSRVTGVTTDDGTTHLCDAVVFNADPFRMRSVIGHDGLTDAYNRRLDNYRRDGTTLKVNLCLADLPQFTCLPEDRGQQATTIHLLPDEACVRIRLNEAFEDAQNGRLPEFPAIEWYIHTTADPSLADDAGHHNAALFVQWVPYEIKGSSWDKERDAYVDHLLSICDRFAPNTSKLVKETFVLAPPDIEEHFGMSAGHIHHVDNGFGFADRLPYETPIDGVYSCSAGCHPAGSVIGAAGHNAARCLLDNRS